MTKKIKQLAVAGSTAATTFLMTVQGAIAQVSIGEDVVAPTGFASNFGSLINAVLSFVMVIAALLVFLYLIWGGIEWITSGGDKGKTESARNKITSAVVGLIILAASYAILLIILNFLGFSDLTNVFEQAQTIE